VPHEPNRVRGERGRDQDGERDHEARAPLHLADVPRGGPGEDGDRADDQHDGDDLPAADVLAEHPHAEGEEKQQAEGEDGLHQRQRRL